MPERPKQADWVTPQADEIFWRGLFDIHLDPLAFIDADYRIIRANLALADALGCRTEDLVGRLCYEALNGERCEACPYGHLLRDGCAHASELGLKRLGGCFWVSVTPVFDDSGLLLGCLHIARNVTAYKTLEADLRAARDEVEARADARARELKEHLQFEKLLVSLALGLSRSVSDVELKAPIQATVTEIGLTGGFGCCGFWKVTGDRACAVARYDDDAHNLAPIPEAVTRETEGCLFAAVACAGVVETTDGDVERCAVGLPPLWEGDTAYALLAVRRTSHPSTRLPLSGERLRLLCQVMGDALRRQAGAFEAQRLREELSRFDQMARLAQLSAALAHELNQPLAATLCNAQAAARLLEESPPDVSEVRSALDDIMASARRAGDVMRQTRALFKGGQQSRQPLNALTFIDAVLKLLRDEIALAGADVVRRCDGEPPTILGDTVQLQQVLINLIKNALDAVRPMPEGSRRITVAVDTAANGDAELSVSDTGSGLPAGSEEAIFTPFQSGKAEGMGMGLSICRQIVTRHGGAIRAERGPSGGARFVVSLPAVPA